MRKRRLPLAALRSHPDWIPDFTPDTGRYVWLESSRREMRELRQALKYAPSPYPSRRRLHQKTSDPDDGCRPPPESIHKNLHGMPRE